MAYARSIPRIPKSTTSTPSGSLRPESRPTTSTPKPSSPRKMLPIPAMRTRLGIGGLRVERHDLIWREEESVPQDVGVSQVSARVVLQRDREVDPFSCSPKKSILVPQYPELADGPVQVHQLFLREGFAPIQDLPRPRVRGAHLRLLLICEGENVQDQELIYLSTIEHVTRAFGGDLRIVGEDYGGRKQHVLGPFLPDQHGPGHLVLTPLRELPQRLGRVCHGDESAPYYLEHRVRRTEGPAQRV